MNNTWRIIALIAVLFSASSAIADNTVVQTNDFSASGTGSGTITQTGSNWAVVNGDGNYVSQLNDKDATLGSSGLSSIIQTVTNGADIAGNSNSVYQSNTGSAVTEATATDATITQTDLNLIFIGLASPSDLNVVHQDNVETATIRYADDDAITQTITNFGNIDGIENYLDQGNNVIALSEGAADNLNVANTIGQTQTNVADMEGGVADGSYKSVAQDNAADAFIKDSDTSAINQNQANNGIQSGDLNSMDQDNVADADIDPSTGVTINQDQANTGIQSGTSNYMDQDNNANADIHSSTSTVIDQDQSNVGNQNGIGNSLDQGSNAAVAVATSSASLAIAQTQTNFADQLGNYNYGQQDNLATGSGSFDTSVTIDQDQANTLLQDGYANSADQDNEAIANVLWSGDQSSINQLQSNFGDQYGDTNTLDQYSIANGYLTAGNDNDASGIGNTINQEQYSTAVMSAWGEDNNVDQDNNADADMTGGWDGTSNQYQSNFADTYDYWDNDAIQSNVGISLVTGDGADVVDQTQTNFAQIYKTANPADSGTWNGNAIQSNYANAITDGKYYDDDDLITQTESNIALITGYWSPVETATQSNVENAVQGYGSSVDITQTASNLATINGPGL